MQCEVAGNSEEDLGMNEAKHTDSMDRALDTWSLLGQSEKSTVTKLMLDNDLFLKYLHIFNENHGLPIAH